MFTKNYWPINVWLGSINNLGYFSVFSPWQMEKTKFQKLKKHTVGNLILHMCDTFLCYTCLMCRHVHFQCMFSCAVITLDELIFIVLSHFSGFFICLLGVKKIYFQKMKITFLTESYYINVYQIL